MGTFSLPIGLMIMCGGEVQGGAEPMKVCLPKLGRHFRVAVWDNEGGKAFQHVHNPKVEMGLDLMRDHVTRANLKCLFGEEVNKSENAVI